MINKIFSILIFVFLLYSCSGSNGSKIQPISYFTPKLRSETKNFKPNIIDTFGKIDQRTESFAKHINKTDAKVSNADLKFTKSNLKTLAAAATLPVIADNQLFVLDKQNNVYCFDLVHKKKIWQTKLDLLNTNQLIISGGLTLDGDKIYITNSSKEVIILEKNTGYQLSRLRLNDVILNPVVCDQKNIYIVVGGNQIFAFDKDKLSLIWQVGGVENNLAVSIETSTKPVSLNNALFIPSITGDFIKINKSTGAVIWQFIPAKSEFLTKSNLYSNITSQILLADDNKSIILPYSSGPLVKLDIEKGQGVWTKDIHDILSANRFGNLLVLANNAKQIAGLSVDTGEIIWTIDSISDKDTTKSYNFLTPVMLNGIINVFYSKGKLYQISTEGNLLNIINTPSNANFYLVHNQLIYLFTDKNIWYSNI